MLHTVTNILLLLAGFICLICGAEGLVRGGRSIGLRLGLTPLFIGLTIVACGTSAPELVVSVGAALQGKGDIGVANAVGSNIFNIALILGLTALITPIKVSISVIKLDIPIMIVVSGVAFWLISGTSISRIAGLFLTSALGLYIALTYYLTIRANSGDMRSHEPVPSSIGLWVKDILFILGGIAMMVLGSNLLVDSASLLARLIGVSEAVIGLTVVAAGTSMPELATSIVAALRRQPDVAVGNVVGSNIFNILGILGVSSLITPLSAPGISMVDLSVMMIAAVVLLPLAWTGMILKRWEGGLLLLGYALYLYWLWPVS
jgi:cation:H+ antiporter